MYVFQEWEVFVMIKHSRNYTNIFTQNNMNWECLLLLLIYIWRHSMTQH